MPINRSCLIAPALDLKIFSTDTKVKEFSSSFLLAVCNWNSHWTSIRSRKSSKLSLAIDIYLYIFAKEKDIAHCIANWLENGKQYQKCLVLPEKRTSCRGYLYRYWEDGWIRMESSPLFSYLSSFLLIMTTSKGQKILLISSYFLVTDRKSRIKRHAESVIIALFTTAKSGYSLQKNSA